MSQDKISYIINDQPVAQYDEAEFGFKKYRDALVNLAVNAETPLCVGILGGWGIGKTSLMNLVFSKLDGDEYAKQVIPIWFNAWRFENEPHLIIALLYVIQEVLLARGESVADSIINFLSSIIAGIKIQAPIKSLTVSYSSKKSRTESKKLSTIAETNSMYFDAFKYLEKIIKKLAPVRLIIFIDDLDRCSSEKTIEMFESIKLLMNFQGIIYFIGADHIMLEKAVSKKYNSENGTDGNSYLKKIFQVYLSIPELQKDDLMTFISTHLNGLDKDSSEKVAKIICFCAGSNPREIKRLINSFWLRYSLNPELCPEKTAFFLVLQERWYPAYNAIIQHKVVFLEFCKLFSEKHLSDDSEFILNKQKFINNLFIFEDVWEYIIAININLEFSSEIELNEYLHFSSISSYKPLQKGELEFFQKIEKLDEESDIVQFKWSISPNASERILQKIDKIVYTLPGDTYPIPKQETTISDHFKITRKGSDNIKIYIAIYLKSGEIEYRSFLLNLQDSEV